MTRALYATTLIALFLCTLCGWIGCTPDSEILCGRWQSRTTISAGLGTEMAAEILPEGIELYLGHYGPDVVGVTRFYDRSFSDDDDCGIGDDPSSTCPCTYIQNGVWRTDTQRFTFQIHRKEDCPHCLISAPGKTIRFDLRLVEDEDNELLTGSVSYIGDPMGEPKQDVIFVRLECETCDDMLGTQCEDCAL